MGDQLTESEWSGTRALALVGKNIFDTVCDIPTFCKTKRVKNVALHTRLLCFKKHKMLL